jgi:hypothetical protein
MREKNRLTDKELLEVLCDTSDYDNLEQWCWYNHAAQFQGRGKKFWENFLNQATEENILATGRYTYDVFSRWTDIMDRMMQFYDDNKVADNRRGDSFWYIHSANLSPWAIERAVKDPLLFPFLCCNTALIRKDPLLGEQLVDKAIALKAPRPMMSLADSPLSPMASVKLTQALRDTGLLGDYIARNLALKKTSPFEVLEILMDHLKDDLWTLRKIGFHPNASVPILETLAVNKDPKVRWGVAKNPNAPQALLEKLKEDKTSSVSQAATQTLKKLGK